MSGTSGTVVAEPDDSTTVEEPATSPEHEKRAREQQSRDVAPVAPAIPSGQQKVEFISWAARPYGVDPNLLLNIVAKESSFHINSINNWDSNAAKGHPSQGLFQFIDTTMAYMRPKARQANPDAWRGFGGLDWTDWRAQTLTAAWAFSDPSLRSHWSSYSTVLSWPDEHWRQYVK